MINNRPGFKLLIIFQAVFFLALTVGESQAAKKKNKDDKRDQSYVMTEAELQAQVMAFGGEFGICCSVTIAGEPSDNSKPTCVFDCECLFHRRRTRSGFRPPGYGGDDHHGTFDL
ncbi:MAG: hypothetical protein JRE29_10260 [Deltaproteobacteria bacterium]|nr:hypothetical protein [Deltaproteobacteria bacterium]